MYKFTNGIVVFDKKTRDRYIEAGYRLVANIKNNKNSVIKINEHFTEASKELNGNETDNDRIIKEKPTTSNKKNTKNRK